MNRFSVYMIEAGEPTFLKVGWAVDPFKRFEQHLAGKGSKLLRGKNKPLRIVFLQSFNTKSEAMSREVEIRRMTREEKLKLVNSNINEIGEIKWH